MGFPGGLEGKECAYKFGRPPGFDPWAGRIHWRRA